MTKLSVMKRNEFIKKSILAIPALGTISVLAKEENSDKLYEQVGFEHISKHATKMKNSVIHKANTRGLADHGWLKSHHTFSFANYYDPERVQFGTLRVLNDDRVAAGMGFGTHPHKNMEIISIPLEGDLEHKDSMGNTSVIRKNDIQIMSAGTGIQHSEYNRNKEMEVKFLQIWVLPKENNITPRYDQITYKPEDRINKFQRIVSPEEDGSVWINQDAYFSLGNLLKGFSTEYTINKKGNGVYAFILKGEVEINDQKLETRDGFGIWDVDTMKVKASTDAEILLMEVPMN